MTPRPLSRRIVILGGGFLGQLLHTLVPDARVLDWRPTAPKTPARSLGAQYLWEPIPGLRNRKFTVTTHVDGRPAEEASVLAYKKKVGKEQDGADWRTQFQTEMSGFEVTLPKGRVEYGQRVLAINRLAHTLHMADQQVIHFDALINTVPLPALMDLCQMTRPPFRSRPIYVWSRPVEWGSSMYVNYVSDPSTDVYRVTLRGSQSHSESLEAPADNPERPVQRLMPGKIYYESSTDGIRYDLMLGGILSVGRYGAWNVDELAHETYRNVAQVVEGWR